MGATVEGILAADSLYGRVQAWWTVAMVNDGIGRGKVTHELQYTEGLSTLRSDLGRGLAFRRELAAMDGLSPSVKREVEGDLNLFISQIEDQISQLEAGGYTAVFKRQKLLSVKRRTLLSHYGKHCRDALDAVDLRQGL